METTIKETSEAAARAFISPETFLEHWQGHRALTRRVIEAFPDDKLFSYAIGGMRPFGELVTEMLQMGAPGVRGVLTKKWPTWKEVEEKYPTPSTKAELLKMWDWATGEIDELWPQIRPERFHEVDKAFDQYEGPIYWSLLYFIDNEIHHRAQGYVYLRSLGIAPPPFWERQIQA